MFREKYVNVHRTSKLVHIGNEFSFGLKLTRIVHNYSFQFAIIEKWNENKKKV